MAGVSVVRGSATRELYLYGTFSGLEREVFRFDLEKEEIVRGSSVPMIASRRDDRDFQHIRAGDQSRLLLASNDKRIVEILLRPPEVAAPSFLFCRQRSLVDQVQVTFWNNGPYDKLELFRDCELIAELDGSAEMVLDTAVQPGVHEYAVRGVKRQDTGVRF